MRPVALIPSLGLSALLAMTLPSCCFGGAEQIQQFQQVAQQAQASVFMATCENECRQGGSGDACVPYCQCMNQRITAENQSAHVEQLAQLGQDAMLRDPWFQGALSACGPTIHDDGFRRGCMEGCTGNCQPYCDCALQQLRSGMTPEQGTLWMIQNLDLGITPDGQTRLDAAVTACVSLMPPQP
jgi:hypothetical protein